MVIWGHIGPRFPEIVAMSLEVRIVRIVMVWGLYWVPTHFGETTMAQTL